MLQIYQYLFKEYWIYIKLPIFPDAVYRHYINDQWREINWERSEDQLHIKDGLLFKDIIFAVPVVVPSPIIDLFHETNLGQFKMKALAEIIWSPRLYREIYLDGRNFSECIVAGGNN